MKCALIIANGIKQIMLSPETEEETAALRLITPADHISVEINQGTFFDGKPPSSALGYLVTECKGEYLRAYEQVEAVMLVLRPKAKSDEDRDDGSR